MNHVLKTIGNSLRNREVWIFSPIYFFLSLINLRAKLFVTPAWFDGTLASNHARLLDFNYTNNEQSRWLQFYIPELFRNIFGLSIENAYILQRWLFLFVTFVCFHFFLRAWFDDKRSFIGVLFLAAIMPLSYFNHLQESASLLLLTFLLALWALRENKIFLFIFVLVLGAFNNETILVLPIAYFFLNFEGIKKRLPVLCAKTIGVSLPAYVVFFVIRYITRDAPHLGGPVLMLPTNLRRMWETIQDISLLGLWKAAYLYLFIIYGVFWVFAFLDFKSKPKFLKRVCWVMPFFIAGNLVTGKILEVRQMLPLAFIVVPMAIFWLFPEEKKPSES